MAKQKDIIKSNKQKEGTMNTKIFAGLLGFVMISSLLLAQPMPMGGDPLAMQEQYLNKLKEKSPKLYEMEKRQMDLRKEVEGILKDYRDKNIGRAEAAAKLTPLLKEQMEMRNNPEYMVEQMLTFSGQEMFGMPQLPQPPQKK
jgi:hypothetical protein